MRVLMPEEMARVDRAAIEVEKIPGLELMERAGEAVARTARDMLSSVGGRRVAILVGKGNNGGDGLVAARRLAGAFTVVVYVVGAAGPGDLSPDSRANLERLSGSTVSMRWLSKPGDTGRLPKLSDKLGVLTRTNSESIVGAGRLVGALAGAADAGPVVGGADRAARRVV